MRDASFTPYDFTLTVIQSEAKAFGEIHATKTFIKNHKTT